MSRLLQVLYFSLFYPHVDYCCELYEVILINLTYNASSIAEKTIRTITHSDYLANTNVLLYLLNILKLSDIITYKSYILGFKVFHVML